MSNSIKIGLNIWADSQLTEIVVSDGHFQRQGQGTGHLSLLLPPGVYKIRFSLGQAGAEQLVALEPNRREVTINAPPLYFDSPAPLDATRTTHEYHRYPAMAVSRTVHETVGQGSSLFIFARDLEWNEPVNVAAGLTLHNAAGDELVDLSRAGQRHPGDQWAGCTLAVDPGFYRLRLATEAVSLELPLIASPDWQTQLFLLRREIGGQRQLDLGGAALLLGRPGPGHGFVPDRSDLRLTEVARQGLSQGRAVVTSDEMKEMIYGKFEDPVLGIYGAHLLLLDEKPWWGLLETMIRNLRRLLPGHPDVEALALALNRAGRDVAPPRRFELPPLLRRSWGLVVGASAGQPELVPAGSLADRIAARLWGAGAWLLWEQPPEPEETTTKGLESTDRGALPEMSAQLGQVTGAVPDRGALEALLAQADLSETGAELLRYLYRANQLQQLRAADEPFSPTAAELARVTGLPYHRLAELVGNLSRTVQTRDSFQMGGDQAVIGSRAGGSIITGEDNVIIGGVTLPRRKPGRVETTGSTQLGGKGAVIGSSAGGDIVAGQGNTIRRSGEAAPSEPDIEAELAEVEQTIATVKKLLSGATLEATLSELEAKRTALQQQLEEAGDSEVSSSGSTQIGGKGSVIGSSAGGDIVTGRGNRVEDEDEAIDDD